MGTNIDVEFLTNCVMIAAIIIVNIVTYRIFLGHRNNGQPKAGAIRSSLIGFAVTIGIVAGYMLAGHLIWRAFG